MSGIKAAPRNPLYWVPSLYFAQGLPFAVVAIMASIMYKDLGISNERITYWTGLMGLAWVFKPLWSPFLEIAASQRMVVVAFQLLSGIAMIVCGLLLHLPGFFTFSLACLSLIAFSSATHDIASDGTYIANLTPERQALYSGWTGAFWNGAKLFAQGGLVTLAGYLEKHAGLLAAQAWSSVMLIPGAVLIALALYHTWSLPRTTQHEAIRPSAAAVGKTLWAVLASFFQKRGIWMAIAFIILFRAGEGQVQTVGRLFLLDSKAAGGLGLTTEQVGIAYGTFPTLAFIVGSVLGGTFAARMPLKRSLFWLILAMNVPNLTFWYLNAYQPGSLSLITSVLSVEMFGYGFGFVGLMLYIMLVVAPGKYPTAHYAIGTGIMQLGYVLFQMMSGTMQSWLGYHHFFIWCVISALPVLILSRIVHIPDGQGGDTAPSGDPDSHRVEPATGGNALVDRASA